MPEDLNKAEERWRNRSLFRPKRRRPWGRVFIVVVVLLLFGLALGTGSQQVLELLQFE